MDAMPQNPRLLNAKIAHLCSQSGTTPSELARIAEVTHPTAAAYLKDTIPSPPPLLRIAQHFKCSVEWFLDDSAPADRPQTTAQRLSDGDLHHELARRYRDELISVLQAVEEAEAVDTMAIAARLFSNPLAKGWPASVPAAVRASPHAEATAGLIGDIYNIDNIAFNRHAELPGSERTPEELTPEAIAKRARKMVKSSPGVLWLARYAELLNNVRAFPSRRAESEAARERFLKQIKAGKAPDPLDSALVRHAPPGSGMEQHFRDRAVRLREQMKRDGFNV